MEGHALELLGQPFFLRRMGYVYTLSKNRDLLDKNILDVATGPEVMALPPRVVDTRTEGYDRLNVRVITFNPMECGISTSTSFQRFAPCFLHLAFLQLQTDIVVFHSTHHHTDEFMLVIFWSNDSQCVEILLHRSIHLNVVFFSRDIPSQPTPTPISAERISVASFPTELSRSPVFFISSRPTDVLAGQGNTTQTKTNHIQTRSNRTAPYLSPTTSLPITFPVRSSHPLPAFYRALKPIGKLTALNWLPNVKCGAIST